MPLFFGGRLYITPTVVSAVNDSAMANRALSVPNSVAFVGRSTGGQPNTVLSFSTPQEARDVLVGGELLDAVTRAFAPSNQTGGPLTVKVLRVNPAVRASLALLDSAPATAITLQSAAYGLHANQTKVKVEAATTAGRKLTVAFGSKTFTQDNVARSAFQIRYAGAQATASMTITGTTVTLYAPNATPVATIDLNSFPTIQQLVDRINATTGFTASVLEGNGNRAALSGLDFVTATDVKTADYTATAHLQAAVDWFNGSGFVTATRGAGGLVPATIGFTFLTGGSDGTVTNTEWSDCFTTLQSADVQWVVPLSSDPAIHAMADAHVQYMSTQGRMERRAICGTAAGTTDAQAITAAKAINSDRTSLMHQGFYDYDVLVDGKLKLFPPYMTAALAASAFAGMAPGNALTNKVLAVRGLERNVRNPTDTDLLILGGVMAVENTSTGYRVVKSISTWLVDSNYNRVEQSCGAALDYVLRTVRDRLMPLKGEKQSPILMNRAVSLAKTALTELAQPEPQGPAVIVGDAANPAFKNVQASISGDVLSVSFQCSPVIPANFITVTVYAVPYSGTVSA